MRILLRERIGRSVSLLPYVSMPDEKMRQLKKDDPITFQWDGWAHRGRVLGLGLSRPGEYNFRVLGNDVFGTLLVQGSKVVEQLYCVDCGLIDVTVDWHQREGATDPLCETCAELRVNRSLEDGIAAEEQKRDGDV